MLKELAHSNGHDDSKLLEILSVIDESDDDLTKMLVAETILDGHLCEMTATCKIKAMRPVVLLYNGERFSAHTKFPLIDYLEAKGITPGIAFDKVKKAYENARSKANDLGISTPTLSDKTTMWDCYWCIAMIFSDYWITVGEDVEKASAMAYEYLSDPDKE